MAELFEASFASIAGDHDATGLRLIQPGESFALGHQDERRLRAGGQAGVARQLADGLKIPAQGVVAGKRHDQQGLVHRGGLQRPTDAPGTEQQCDSHHGTE